MRRGIGTRAIAVATSIVLCTTVAACGFEGVNSLPLPGTVGGGHGATTYRVMLANVGTLEANSPVMVNDVVIGSVRRVAVAGDHAQVDVSIKPGVVIPANAVAAVGQTSLLGSMHLELAPPLGEPGVGRLADDAIIPIDRTTTFPSTEQTLASLAAVVNGGGLGQIGDIIHNFNAALNGRQADIRQLLVRLETFIGTLNGQRDNIIATITELNRFSATFAGQQDAIGEALREIPPALDILRREEPRLASALEKLGTFSDTARGVIDKAQGDLVKNLSNLDPTLRALADVGDDIDTALSYLTTFPLSQNLVDRGIRGDYMNLFVTIDLTNARLKRGLLAGTRWGDEDAPLVPAPGDPGYDAFYTTDPMGVGVSPQPAPPDPPPPAPIEVTVPSAGGG